MQAETTFKDDIRPILRAECMTCHNPDKAKGGLDLATYETLLQGGSSGEIVTAGDPEGSRLVQVLAHVAEPFMPENASKRPDEEIEIIKQWIAGGLLKQSGDTAKVPKANKIAMLSAEASAERPSGPPPLPRNGRLEPYVRTPRPNAVIALAASPWAPLTAIGGHRQIALYHDETRELVDVRSFDEGLPTTVRFSRNASVLLAAGGVGAQSGSVVLWDVKTGERIATVGDEYDTVLAADLSADQRWVALGGSDKNVKVLAVESGEVVHKIKKHTDWILAAAFSPDGVLLATGDRSGGLTVWETESGQEFHDLRGHQDAITEVRWRRDSNVLASASEDGQIKLWDLHKGKQIKSWKAHKDGVLDLAYAKDGSLASVGRDGRARIWNPDGKQQREIKEFADLPTRCAFSHDDTRLLVGDWTGQVTVWQVDNGERLGDVDANPPRLDERVAMAASARDQAHSALEKMRNQERKAAATVESVSAELTALENRRAEADARYAALERQLDEARSLREAADTSLNEARTRRESVDTRLAGLAESLQTLEHRLQATRKEWQALQSPAESKTMSNPTDEAVPPPAPEIAAEVPAESAKSTPALEQLQGRLNQLEAERDGVSREMKEAQTELKTIRVTEREREQAAQQAAQAIQAAEQALVAAEAERKKAGDVIPAKQNELQKAEAQAAEAATALAAAQATFDEQDAEHHQWVDAARYHAIREAGISEGGTFANEVLPILEARCIKCHSIEKSKGKFRLDRPDLIVKGGTSGEPGVVFGDPGASELMARISLPPDDLDAMPPEEEENPLTAREVELIRNWIEGHQSF